MIETKFKQTEVGMIPVDWEIKTIKNIAPLKRGFDLPTHKIRKGTIPVVYSNGICNFHNIGVCKAPGLITGRSGTIGKFTFISEGMYWPHNTSLWVTSFCGNIPKYVYYLYSSLNFELYSGGSGVPTLNRNNLHEQSVGLPPLHEQQRIAEALSDVDALISSLGKMIEKKRNIKLATMQQLLTGKQRLPGFTAPWVNKKLEAIGSTYNGLSGKTANDFGRGCAKYVTFLNVLNNPIIDCKAFEDVNVGIHEKQNKVQKGDLLFNTSSETPEEVGICATLNEDVENLYLNSFCFGFRVNEGYSPVFLSYFFRGKPGRLFMTTLAQGSTRYNLSKENMLKSSIFIPSSQEEQTAIANILMDIDNEIAKLETRKKKYEAIKQGMMQQLLSGKIRLTNK